MDEPNNSACDDELAQMQERLREAFKDEAYELLAELEAVLLELETDCGSGDLIARLFRAMHTLKGSGGACGFDDLSRFAHEIESFLDIVRKGKAPMTKEIVDLSLLARDRIKAMLDGHYGRGPVDPAEAAGVLAAFRALFARTPLAPVPHAGRHAGAVTYRIRYRPDAETFQRGIDPAGALTELRGLGPCTVVAHTCDIPPIEDLRPDACCVRWDVILTTDRTEAELRSLPGLTQGAAEVSIAIIDDPAGAALDEDSCKKLGEILLERGDLTEQALRETLETRRKIGEELVERGAVQPDSVRAALAEQECVKAARESRMTAEAQTSIRVSTDKLDGLVNLVGELVTVQARLSRQAMKREDDAELQLVAEDVERLTAELRDRAMGMRTLPIGTTFSRFRRLVRDLSRELGREAELITEGADTELDKTVIERLGDPLMHLIRNSMDHGIEPPEERLAAGKPRAGTIRLTARHSGAHVQIRIDDDGRGMDREAIRSRALEKGLLRPDERPGDRELFSLVLAPGFTTSENVTNVSGRGVGMDVVKRAIEALRGTVAIESAAGAGTTIVLTLPLTLAIIDGFLTRVGGGRYIFPLSLVEECIELSQGRGGDGNNRRLVDLRGQVVPYVRLRDQFREAGAPPPVEQIVITRTGDARLGFVVDEIIGGHQTVIKNLGRYYANVDGVSGATILGDGSVALILDLPRLARIAEAEEAVASG